MRTQVTLTRRARSWRDEVFCDWQANRDSTKSQVILAAFRCAHRLHTGPDVPRPLAKAAVLAYKVLTTWVLGVELPAETEVGRPLRLIHPQGIVVNGETRIGSGCIIRASTTIGNVLGADGTPTSSPVIGNDVELGANVVVIGPVTLGNGARVGAGAVVIADVPAGAVAVGNPARILAR